MLALRQEYVFVYVCYVGVSICKIDINSNYIGCVVVCAYVCVCVRVRASASEHACILVFALPLTCFKTYAFVCVYYVGFSIC